MNRAYRAEGAHSLTLAVEADYIYKDTLKVAGGRWNPAARRWELPYTAETWESVSLSIPGLVGDEAVNDDLRRVSAVLDRPILPAPPMPLKPGVVPFQHQLAAYAEALHVFGLAQREETYG